MRQDPSPPLAAGAVAVWSDVSRLHSAECSNTRLGGNLALGQVWVLGWIVCGLCGVVSVTKRKKVVTLRGSTTPLCIAVVWLSGIR